MGVESQAILEGHISVDRIVRLISAEVSGPISVRDMQRPEYKIIEFQAADGSWSALNIFLYSWAAEDYAEVYRGQSTLLTIGYSPRNFNLVRSITAAVGGLARKSEADAWVELEPSRI